MPNLRHSLAAIGCALTLAAASFSTMVADAGASVAAPQYATPWTQLKNPLVGRPMGVYKGAADQPWVPYTQATGTTKDLLGYIALMPKSKWFGQWIATSRITADVKSYIANAQAGNPEALVQLAVFGMVPWEGDACKKLPTAAQQTAYKAWINAFAAGIGDAHTAIILQPDGPFALCAPGGSQVYSQLISYAAQQLSANRNTAVYIDAGAADWPAAGAQGGVDAAVRILTRGGIRYARGFALNSTHYSSTTAEVQRAADISRKLDALGYPGKKGVIDTAQNGHPWVFGAWKGTGPADDAPACTSKTAPATQTCITLGIPPTTDVGNPKWKLSATTNAQAKAYVDAYLWFGRPWLKMQADPFVQNKALDLVRSTPWR